MPATKFLRALVVLAGVFELLTALGSLFVAPLLKRWFQLPADFDVFYLQLTGSYQFILAAGLLLGGLGQSDLRSVARLAILFHAGFLVFAVAAALGAFPVSGPTLGYMRGCIGYHGVMLVLTAIALKRCGFTWFGAVTPAPAAA